MVEREYVLHPQKHRGNERAYSKAVITRGGRTAYLAGVTNSGPDGRPVVGSNEAATRAVFAKLDEAVQMSGGTLGDIVTMTVFITDPRYGDEFVRLRREYFEPDHYPASALITCAALAQPGLTIEIQAIAVIDDDA